MNLKLHVWRQQSTASDGDFVEYAANDISPDEIATFSHRNVVTKCLGSKDEIDPTVSVESLLHGDIYLLCTDGLWGVVPDDKLVGILTDTDLVTALEVLLQTSQTAPAAPAVQSVRSGVPA